jgi:alkylation response protein AidB-like acyl-CoA dehydrogenase
MQLDYTPAQQAFRAQVRGFLARELPADISHKVKNGMHLDKTDMVDWQKILHARGWGAAGWPKDYGGPGFSPIEEFIFEEECALVGAPRQLPFGLKMVAPVIMAFGTPQQCARFLPRIASGEDWWCQGYSEPGSGSDLASLRCKAERDGDHYVVNGQKTWTTLGQYADWIFCLVRTDAAAKPQAGISFLLIDMKTPGVTVKPIILMDGAHEVNEVFFDNVRVPVENRVGEENKGWTYAKFLLGHERVNIAGVGVSKRELAHVKALARSEMRRGRPLADDPLFRARLAEAEIALMMLEITNLRVIAEGEHGKAPGPAASVLKLRGTEIHQAISELAVEALGPASLPYDDRARFAGAPVNEADPAAPSAVAGHYMNLRKVSIYGGSNQIQKNIIAQGVLGL